MKLLILHFSDMHIHDENILQVKEQVASFFKNRDQYDDCLLIFSGDISNDGRYYSYKTASSFIGFLINKLRNEAIINNKIEVAVVPGNHDLDHNGKSRNRLEVKSSICDTTTATIISEVNKFENFYEFAKISKSFKNDHIVDNKKIIFSDYEVNLILINSALFSLCKDNNGDNDKGLHIIPDENINRFDFSKLSGYKLCVSHYPMTWMTWDSSLKMEKTLINSIDFVFTGHEHKPSVYCKDIGNGRNIIYSEGGAFDKSESYTFNYLVLDTEENIIESNTLKFNNGIFIKEIDDDNKYNLRSCGNNFPFTDAFVQKFYYDPELISKKILDYFVFPRLMLESKKTTTTYSSFDQFNKGIKDFTIINIYGESLSGKTTLGKYLFNSLYSKNMVPIFLLEEDVIGNKKTDKIIKDCFNEQYGIDKVLYEKFLQLDPSNKILIIDGAEIREDLFESIGKLLEQFSKIIFLGDRYLPFDIKEMLENFNQKKANSVDLRIVPFYEDKRNELVDVICKQLNKNKIMYDFNESSIDLIKKQFSNDILIFSFYPKHIIVAIKMFFNSSLNKDKNSSIFAEYFNADMREKLLKYINEKELVKPALAILKKMAYELNQNKTHPFDYTDMVNHINKYNENYEYDFEIQKIINVWIDAKIIKSIGNNRFRFYSKNYYSFLIASELNSRILTEEGLHTLKDLIDNVHKYINDDILLFFLCITENQTVLQEILKRLFDFFNQYGEFNFEKGNYSFLKQTFFERIICPDETEKKHSAVIRVSSEEKEIERASVNNDHDFYSDKNTEELQEIFSKMISYLRIVSRILPNFNFMLDKDLKRGFIELIYRIPNKILYLFFNLFEKIYDDFITDFHDNMNKYSEKQVTKEEVEKLFDSVFQTLIFSLYNFSMQYAVDGQTKKLLYNANVIHESYNHRIQKLFVFRNKVLMDDFIKEFRIIFNENKNVTIKTILKMLAYDVFVNYEGKETPNMIAFKGEVLDPKENNKLLAAKTFSPRK